MCYNRATHYIWHTYRLHTFKYVGCSTCHNTVHVSKTTECTVEMPPRKPKVNVAYESPVARNLYHCKHKMIMYDYRLIIYMINILIFHVIVYMHIYIPQCDGQSMTNAKSPRSPLSNLVWSMTQGGQIYLATCARIDESTHDHAGAWLSS